ncbi:MAG TPA: ABC transporter permease [Vicinamibacterales bacterium]|nr:ABC transporter permease [Vicinamibacterales bacterium]
MAITFKLALRRLRRSPLATTFSAATLAIAVGAAGAAAVLLNAIVLRPLDVRAPEQLVSIAPMIGEALLGIPGETLAALQNSIGTVGPVCGYSRGAVGVQLGERISRKGLEAFSGSCYGLLGVEPLHGRLISEQDAPLVGESAPVVVLAYSFWKGAHNGDQQIIGKILTVEGRPLTIIGVLPQSFAGMHVDQGPDIVVPLGLTSTLMGQAPRTVALYGIARVSSPSAIDQLRVDLRSKWSEWWRATTPISSSRPAPAADPANLEVESVQRGISDLRKQYAQALYLLVGLSSLLVLMAAANVSGLWVARAAHRASELKTLAAVGADSPMIVRLLAVETLLVAIASAAGAMLVSVVVTGLVAQQLWIGFLPLTMRLAPTAEQLWLVALTTASLMFALSGPATLLSIRHTRAILRPNSTGSTLPWRSGLLMAQAAVTLVLVFAAMLATKHLIMLNRINPGYSPEGLSWGRLERLSGAERFDRGAYIEQLVSDIERHAGVESAAMSNTFPTTEQRHLSALLPAARPGSEVSTGVREFKLSPGFFRTLGVPLVSGRDFHSGDDAEGARVAIVNTTLARRLFPAEDPVGQPLVLIPSKRTLTIVGVVADFSPGDVRIKDLAAVYSPYLQDTQPLGTSFVVIRSHAGMPFSALAAVVAAGDHHYLSVYRSVREHLITLVGRERVLFSLSTVFGTMGILLGAAGIFAALAHSVTMRAKELAVRVAMGAQRLRIIGAVVTEVTLSLSVGVALGVPLAWLVGRTGTAILSNHSFTDTPLLIASVLTLIAASTAAAVVPTRRALRVDPALLLKE